MATPHGDAELWRQRAQQCRARADKLNDPIIRGRMLMIADHYDRIAHDIEKTDAKTKRSAKMVSAFAPLICISRLLPIR